MKKNKIILFSILIMLCFSAIPLIGSTQENIGDEIVNMPSQGINPRPNMLSVTTKYIQIKWNESGCGIYFHIEFNNTISSIYIINKSIYEYYQEFGGAINDSIALSGLTFYAKTELDYQFILPYEDTFYFFIVNSNNYAVWMTGWYARDITVPNGIIWGIENNYHFNTSTTVSIGCYYGADRFNITKLIFSSETFYRETETNTNGPLNWTVELNTHVFVTSGQKYINFTVADGVGNSGSILTYIYIDEAMTTPIILLPDTMLIISIICGFVILGVVVGLYSYWNIKKEENEKTEEQKKKEKERPYHKTHRDSKKDRKGKKKGWSSHSY